MALSEAPSITTNIVHTISLPSSLSYAVLNGQQYRCSLGRGGLSTHKQEGDGTTPVGVFPLRQVFYRQDRLYTITTALPVAPIQPADAWCDDSSRAEYNTKVTLPFSGSCERMWREDSLYDIIVVIGYNDCPVIKGKGSALFLHVARKNYAPTAGCLAFAKKELLQMLAQLQAGAMVSIAAKGVIEFK